MGAARTDEPVCPDFDVVLAALDAYARRTGRPVTRLGGWEIEDETIRPPSVLEERLAAVGGCLCSYAYAKELHRAKERAAEVLGATIRRADSPLAARDVAVLQNSTQALLLALAALKERGVRRLVVAAPCYYAPVRIAQTLGLGVEIIPAADYLTGAVDVFAVRSAVARPGSALLVTNPAYSVGVDYDWARLGHLFAALPPDLPIVLDETRLGLSWRSSAPWYEANYPANVAILRSPSKVFFINGAKCSLLLAAPSLVSAVERLSEALVGSVPGSAEQVALAYLDAWEQWAREHATGRRGEMLAWRAAVVERLRCGLAQSTGPLRAAGFVLSPADSGPYALAALPRAGRAGIDSRVVAETSGVLIMDASYFLHTSDDWVGFRLNLCAAPDTTSVAIERVLRHLRTTPKREDRPRTPAPSAQS